MTRWSLLPLLLLAAGCVSLVPYEQLIAGVPPEQLISVAGRKVYVEDRGAGPPVLLVHGFGASSYSWREVIRELEDDFRIVAVDLAGFGLSERPTDKNDYTRFAQGELLLGVLDALGIDRVHLVGHSYGGSVSVALAVRHRERIESLTMVDSAAPEYPRLRRSPVAGLRPLTYLFVRTRSLRRSNVEASLRRSAADDSIVDAKLVDEYWRRLAVEGSPRAFWGLTTPLRDPQGTVSLAELEVPTLLVWGGQDVLIPPSGAREAGSSIARSHFVLMPEAGHAPMEDRPRELAAILRKFFALGLTAFD